MIRKDHLGSNREVWKVDGNTIATIQRTQYYPSGLPWAEGIGAGEQPYKHNSTEFIEMHGYDVSGHGRRGLHHASGRYTTMDRFAENFPWQPPYVHAANNPVNYVDVGGDSIWTTINGLDYYWGAVNDNYGFIGADGEMYDGSDKYVKSLTKALNDLRTGEAGRGLVDFLARNAESVTIVNGGKNQASSDGSTISWNNSNSNPDFSRPGFIGLGHEMAHIQDAWNKTLDMTPWTTIIDVNGKSKDIPNAEKYALHMENQIRGEQGKSLRTHYVIDGTNNTQFIRNGASMYYYKGILHSTIIVNGLPATTVTRIPFKYKL